MIYMMTWSFLKKADSGNSLIISTYLRSYALCRKEKKCGFIVVMKRVIIMALVLGAILSEALFRAQ